jgi:protein-S-isoprenylcysteine O-methyltransferase Ste14
VDADVLAWGLHGLAWLSFGLVHSLLAAGAGRRLLTALCGRGHRLAYNAVALVHLGAVYALGWALLDRVSFLPEAAARLLDGVTLLGLGFGLWALRFYDGGRLLGLRQWRNPAAEDDEALRLDGPHRWIRHPLYTAAFLILWGRAGDALGLSTALWGSLYLVVGTWFEERKLLALYGAAYASYRRRVPAYVPWKGRAP